jgi:hypothetical protein
LEFNFLERPKLASPSLHMQRALSPIPLALITNTVSDRRKLLVHNLLVDFGTATVAGIAVHQEERFDFRNAGDNPSGGDKFTEVDAFDFANS